MTAVAIDWAHTRRAVQGRSVKASRLADTALAAGVVTCQLRASYPGLAQRRRHLLQQSGVRAASTETWRLVLEQVDEVLVAATGQRCAQCGSPVRIVNLPTVPRAPLDPLPHPEGDVVLAAPARQHDVPLARALLPSETVAAGVQRYRSHHHTCAIALAAQRATPRTLRRCLACLLPLAQWAAASDPTYVIHPCCEEPLKARRSSTKTP